MTGLEPFIEPAARVIGGIVIKTGLQQGGKQLSWLGKRLDEATKQLIFRASQQYVKKYGDRHCHIKPLRMRESVSLETIYTTVQLLSNWDARRFETVEGLQEIYRGSNQRQFHAEDIKKEPGIEIANQKQYLMVLGAPGSGKTTFLRKMGLEALKGEKWQEWSYQCSPRSCIPAFLELKRFTKPEINIQRAIAEEFEVCGFPYAEEYAAAALEEGKLLVLLDGLDEVPTANKNTVVDTIQDFVDKYDKNRFILSCRTAARESLQRFSDVVIAEFNDKQIEQFIINWFQSEADKQVNTAEECWKLLQEPQNQGALELARTPLLLTFLCLVYDRSQNFPSNYSVLYRKALRILLEEWASEKRIQRDEIYQGLHTELEEILLSEIAYGGF